MPPAAERSHFSKSARSGAPPVVTIPALGDTAILRGRHAEVQKWPTRQPEHIVGVVVVRVVIDKSGGVLNADYVSGPPALVPAAVDAVKQWKYQPYLLSGEPFEVETTVEISFTL